MEKTTYKRLESLDALRGFDLFFLVALGPLAHSLARAADVGWLNDCMWAFNHVQWEGFSPWDLIMPLFLFMSGASMPFALSRFKGVSDKKTLFRRLGKRILLLWIFGMMCQGNLLGFDPDRIYLYSNTLQSIAAGYLITAVLFLYTRRRSVWRWPCCLFIGRRCSSLRSAVMEVVITHPRETWRNG